MRAVVLGVWMLCVLDLRLPAGAVGVAAPAACTSAPGSVAVFNLCIAVTGTRLDTVRVVLDKVVDIILRSVYVFPLLLRLQYCWYRFLYAPSRGVESASRRMVFSSLSSGRWLSAGPPCENCASRSSSAAWHASI